MALGCGLHLNPRLQVIDVPKDGCDRHNTVVALEAQEAIVAGDVAFDAEVFPAFTIADIVDGMS